MAVARSRIRLSDLAVLDARVAERPGQRGIDIDAGDHQRPKKVPLAAFVDAEVRFEKLWRVDFLVTEFRLTEDFRLQHERDEILDAFPLDHCLRAFFVNGDVEFELPRRVEHVGLFLELVALFFEHFAEVFRLLRGEGSRVGVQSFC